MNIQVGKNTTNVTAVGNIPAGPLPPPPPPPMPPMPPSSVAGFCPSASTETCVKALTSPLSAPIQCTANYQHAEQYVLNHSAILNGLQLDVQGNGVGEMLVKGLVYSDNHGSPDKLLGASNAVSVSAHAKRSWVPLPFADMLSLSAGVYWLGEIAAGAPGHNASTTGSAGKDDLACFGWPVDASDRKLHRPCVFTAQPFASGPRAHFGTASQCGTTSLDVFGTVTQ